MVTKDYVTSFNKIAGRISSRTIQSMATAGLVHAKHIEVLKQSVVVMHINRNVNRESVVWESKPPEKLGNVSKWSHTFRIGSVRHEVVFMEDGAGQLSIYVNDVDTKVRVGNYSGFTKKDYRKILTCLGV